MMDIPTVDTRPLTVDEEREAEIIRELDRVHRATWPQLSKLAEYDRRATAARIAKQIDENSRARRQP